MKELIKNIFPPFLLQFVRRFSGYGWFGNYYSWEEATKRTSGYNDDAVVEKCRQAALAVKNKEALFERDSVLFYEAEYSNVMLLGIISAIADMGKNISIVDFGGSFGSSYHQNNLYLKNLDDLFLKWNVIEQEKFVKIGKQEFEEEGEELKFYYNIEELFEKDNRREVLILSSVVQYIEKPFKLLAELAQLGFKYIIIDRTPFLTEDKQELITVQKVKPSIYKGSYPCWIFNEIKFFNIFNDQYDVIFENESLDRSNKKGVIFKGFVLKLKHDK